MTEPRELAELIASGEAVPAAGWVAGVTAALAAALVAKAAARSESWSEAGGVRAQAVELRDRLLELAADDARAYDRALTALEQRDEGLAQALAEAADVPRALADAAADVALLAAEAAERADGAARADAASAAPLAAGAAQAAAKLVGVNLASTPGDEQVTAADRAAQAAADAARRALAADL